MTTTIVNDDFFKPDGDIEEGKAAAAELVEPFKKDFPEVQLSLWLESEENPLHHYHITVFDNAEVIDRVKKNKAIEVFVGRAAPGGRNARKRSSHGRSIRAFERSASKRAPFLS